MLELASMTLSGYNIEERHLATLKIKSYVTVFRLTLPIASSLNS